MATEPQVSTGELAVTSNPPTTPIPVFRQDQVNQNLADTGTNAPVITLNQSQTTPNNPGPVPYIPPSSGITTFEDGTTRQEFEDGSVITTDNTGARSATNATEVVAPKLPAAAAPPADSGPAVPSSQNPGVQPGRNKYFTNDYYLDDLEIDSAFTTGGPSNFTSIEFKVTEPNGMSLLFNLNNAIRDLYQQPTGAINCAHFVMVIRFYGWDEKGNLVSKVAPVAGTPGTVPNTSNAVVTKYFPFQLNELTFKNAGKQIEYHFKGTNQSYKYAQHTALGSVPEDFQLVGETVEQVLNGTSTATMVSGDDSKRKTKATPQTSNLVKDLPMNEQAAIAAGTDPNAVNPQGMAFGGGGL